MTGIFALDLDPQIVNPTSGKFDPKLAVKPVAGSGQKGGVGGAFYTSIVDNTTHAIIEDEVAIFSGADGGFNVKADEAFFDISLGQAGASGGKFAIGGTVMYNERNSDTLA